MSDTPRTDAVHLEHMGGESTAYNEYGIMFDHARTLERELNAVKKQLEYLRTWGGKCQDEMEHQAKLAMDWRAMARDLARDGFFPAAMPASDTLARFASLEKGTP